MVRGELRRRRWKEADLRRRAKGDPGKVALASKLRQQTTLPLVLRCFQWN
jgi:hypothetical protein